MFVRGNFFCSIKYGIEQVEALPCPTRSIGCRRTGMQSLCMIYHRVRQHDMHTYEKRKRKKKIQRGCTWCTWCGPISKGRRKEANHDNVRDNHFRCLLHKYESGLVYPIKTIPVDLQHTIYGIMYQTHNVHAVAASSAAVVQGLLCHTSVNMTSPGFVHLVFSNLFPTFDRSKVSSGSSSVDRTLPPASAIMRDGRLQEAGAWLSPPLLPLLLLLLLLWCW